MMLIFGLTLMLETAACLKSSCRFNQAGPCYAALGHTLNLLMAPNTRKHDLRIRKIINSPLDDPFCTIKNNRIKNNKCDLFNSRAGVTVSNGILTINRVIGADSGTYALKHELSDNSEIKYLQVIVEAPIGSVEVSIICSSIGVMRASCSSDGDPLLFSWTVNGDPVMDGNTTIDLDEGTDGSISCSVKNNVSHRQKNITVKHCPGDGMPYSPTVRSVRRRTEEQKNISVKHSPGDDMPSSPTVRSVSAVLVLVWCFLLCVLGLLAGVCIYMRLTSGKKQKDETMTMKRLKGGHEESAEG